MWTNGHHYVAALNKNTSYTKCHWRCGCLAPLQGRWWPTSLLFAPCTLMQTLLEAVYEESLHYWHRMTHNISQYYPPTKEASGKQDPYSKSTGEAFFVPVLSTSWYFSSKCPGSSCCLSSCFYSGCFPMASFFSLSSEPAEPSEKHSACESKRRNSTPVETP